MAPERKWRRCCSGCGSNDETGAPPLSLRLLQGQGGGFDFQWGPSEINIPTPSTSSGQALSRENATRIGHPAQSSPSAASCQQDREGTSLGLAAKGRNRRVVNVLLSHGRSDSDFSTFVPAA